MEFATGKRRLQPPSWGLRHWRWNFSTAGFMSTTPPCTALLTSSAARRPDLIITHHPDDYHGDHRAVSKLVVDASFAAGLSYYVTDLAAVAVTPSVYFMDTLAGIDFAPEEFVDITATIEVKLAAMRSHVSQVTWIREHHASDIEDLIRTVAHFRGLQCGVPYAEGFQRLRAWGRLGTNRELP